MDQEMPERIAVIGSPGAGKSTLAAAIAGTTGLPLTHFDREYWRPGWVEPDAGDWQRDNARLVAGERWVIDGNYGSSLQARLDRADLVIWLDLPTATCLRGAVRRMMTYRGRARPDMRDGCPERINGDFARFLWYIVAFRRAKVPALERKLVASRVRVVRLTSAADRAAFAAALPGSLAK